MKKDDSATTETRERLKQFTFPAGVVAEATMPQISFPGFQHTDGTLEILAHDYNVNQKLITITEDKTFMCLNRHIRNVGKKRWIQPLSLFITMLLALATSDFNKLTWISSDLLKATFIVSSTVTAGWLIWEVVKDSEQKEIAQVITDIFDELRKG